MSKYTWDESPKRDRVYLEHIDVSNVHFYAVAYACLQHSGGWVGKYLTGSGWVSIAGEYPLEEIKRILETTVELLE